jgi:hypothetical protein
LADEAFEYLLGHPRIEDGLRALLWKHKLAGDGFEAEVEEQRTETARSTNSYRAERDAAVRSSMMGVMSNVPMLDHSQRLDEAIRGMFADMNKAFAQRGTFDFMETGPTSVNDFLAGFDAIFTLNQDLLMEHLYQSDHLSMLSQQRDWYMPGTEPTKEPPGTAIRDVTEWRPMNPDDLSKFTVDANRQPYFKLHGSSNWIDRSGRQPMPVIGGNKPEARGIQF